MTPRSTAALVASSLRAPGLGKILGDHNEPLYVDLSHCNQHSPKWGCRGNMAA